MEMIDLCIKALVVPLCSPLVIGIIRKLKAYMQNRRGAKITQPYADLIKLFRKHEVVSHDATWVFFVAPFIMFSISLLIPLGIPILTTIDSLPFLSDLLVIIYTLAVSTFFLALAGIDVGSAFGGFGSSREMTFSALTEGAFVFSLLPGAMASHTSNLVLIATSIQTMPTETYLPILIAFPAFLCVLLVETKRFPFDNPATHLELTMIHEAMILEYSGKRLALVEWASYNYFLMFTFLGMNIFFPWGLASVITLPSLVIAIVSVASKVLIVAGGVALLESVIAKYRFFRLPDVLLTAFILGIISLVMSI